MLCQNCQKRVANVHFTQIINNKKTEMYLCEQCADEKGHIGFISPVNISSFLSGLAGGSEEPYLAPVHREAACQKCGMSFDDFQRTGKLGCDNCYEVFGNRLKPILKRLHGNFEHSGKVPAAVSAALGASKEIEKLKEMLNKAIQNEEYEKAAEIRDRIKALENKQNS